MAADGPIVSEDRLLGGRLILRQLTGGHRAGTDAILLAAAAAGMPGDSVVDIGSGVGTVGLAIALRDPTVRVRLVEREADVAALARDNIALNGLGERAEVAHRDILAERGPGDATLVVSNPPFYPLGTVRVSPHPGRARAHGLAASGHAGWMIAMLGWCAAHARVIVIHRPDALPALLAACEGRLGGVRVRPVHARPGDDATRILLAGIVGSRAPFALASPLVLHGPDGHFTPEVEALHRGDSVNPLLPVKTQKSRP